jgi:hypothetical protein
MIDLLLLLLIVHRKLLRNSIPRVGNTHNGIKENNIRYFHMLMFVGFIMISHIEAAYLTSMPANLNGITQVGFG